MTKAQADDHAAQIIIALTNYITAVVSGGSSDTFDTSRADLQEKISSALQGDVVFVKGKIDDPWP